MVKKNLVMQVGVQNIFCILLIYVYEVFGIPYAIVFPFLLAVIVNVISYSFIRYLSVNKYIYSYIIYILSDIMFAILFRVIMNAVSSIHGDNYGIVLGIVAWLSFNLGSFIANSILIVIKKIGLCSLK
jgi:hypothetical protein